MKFYYKKLFGQKEEITLAQAIDKSGEPIGSITKKLGDLVQTLNEKGILTNAEALSFVDHTLIDSDLIEVKE